MADEKVIKVEHARPGYAHTQYAGTYEGPVTVEDLREKFPSPFGGRLVSLAFGKFVYCRHDD